MNRRVCTNLLSPSRAPSHQGRGWSCPLTSIRHKLKVLRRLDERPTAGAVRIESDLRLFEDFGAGCLVVDTPSVTASIDVDAGSGSLGILVTAVGMPPEVDFDFLDEALGPRVVLKQTGSTVRLEGILSDRVRYENAYAVIRHLQGLADEGALARRIERASRKDPEDGGDDGDGGGSAPPAATTHAPSPFAYAHP